jgi:uncharacterized phage protein (TIGR01671 family)
MFKEENLNMKYQLVSKDTNMVVISEFISLSSNGELFYEGSNVTDQFHIRKFSEEKDSNGKEIYEGDIIKVNKLTFESSVPLPQILNVNYYAGTFQFFRGNECLMGLHLSYLVDGEVIGNIYENPELVPVRTQLF